MRDLNDKVTGNTLTADEWNDVPSELQNLIESQGITLSGADLTQAVKSIAAYSTGGQFFTGGGVADAYTATAPAPRVNPTARQEGAIIRFIAPATNTGACTLNAFSLGVDDIKLSDGTTDPAAGDIVSGKTITVIDRLTYFELDRTGMVRRTTVTSSDATWTPQPDTKSIVFEKIIGAGASGGSTDGQGAGTSATASGGGSGSWARKAPATVSSSYNITIGTGGASPAAGNNSGNNGGSTTVVDNDTGTVVNVTAGGGLAGQGVTGTSGSYTRNGGLGGTASGGDENYMGNAANTAATIGGDPASTGNGAPSVLGGGTLSIANGDGDSATTPGAGGAGASSADDSANRVGGAGADGEVDIVEYL